MFCAQVIAFAEATSHQFRRNSTELDDFTELIC